MQKRKHQHQHSSALAFLLILQNGCSVGGSKSSRSRRVIAVIIGNTTISPFRAALAFDFANTIANISIATRRRSITAIGPVATSVVSAVVKVIAKQVSCSKIDRRPFPYFSRTHVYSHFPLEQQSVEFAQVPFPGKPSPQKRSVLITSGATVCPFTQYSGSNPQ